MAIPIVAVIIPAFNEEDIICQAIADVPKSIGSFLTKIIVIDDGSSDNTVEFAYSANVDKVISLGRHLGLGTAHVEGIRYAISINADIIVNFDADMQYKGQEIERLIEPLFLGESDVVIGDRRISSIQDYPKYKLFTQHIWSAILSYIYNVDIMDATSGFRAYNREAASILAMKLTDSYTYTAESIYILARWRKRVVSVPITIRLNTRKSKLITNKVKYSVKLFQSLFKDLLNNGIFSASRISP